MTTGACVWVVVLIGLIAVITAALYRVGKDADPDPATLAAGDNRFPLCFACAEHQKGRERLNIDEDRCMLLHTASGAPIYCRDVNFRCGAFRPKGGPRGGRAA